MSNKFHRVCIEKRIIAEANYFVCMKSTLRKTAVSFSVSKATIHKDITEKLPALNYELYKQVKRVIDLNKAERAVRGGAATRRKYEELSAC